MTMRSLDSRIWSDGWVRKLNALDRYLFIYLLTNEHSTWCGVYELDLAMMAFESGIDREDLERAMLPRLSPKAIYVDGWVYIPNWMKYHLSGGGTVSPQQQKGFDKALSEVPERIRLKIKEIEKNGYPMVRVSPSASAFTSTYSLITASEEAENEEDFTIEEDEDVKKYSYFPKKPKDQNAKLILATAEKKYGFKSAAPAKEMGHIAAMVKMGFSQQDIFDTIDRLQKDEFWGDKGITFGIVRQQIGVIKSKRASILRDSDFN